jgi:hypothetical protein
MYISIDVGIKNLAYIVYGETIIEWNVIELCNTNASKANIIDIGKKLFEALNISSYDTYSQICNDSNCPLRIDGGLLYRNKGYLTVIGSEKVFSKFQE